MRATLAFKDFCCPFARRGAAPRETRFMSPARRAADAATAPSRSRGWRALRLPAGVRMVGLWVAAAMAATGLALIWSARLAADRFLYVSELGATGESTAEVFRWGMTLIAVSAAVVAVCAPRLSPRLRWLAL